MKINFLVLLIFSLTVCISYKNSHKVRISFDRVCITTVTTGAYEEELLCNQGVLFDILF